MIGNGRKEKDRTPPPVSVSPTQNPWRSIALLFPYSTPLSTRVWLNFQFVPSIPSSLLNEASANDLVWFKRN